MTRNSICSNEPIIFPCRGGVFVLFPDDEKILRDSFPSKDIDKELREAKAWCHANSSKRKTIRGMMRFLNGWLSRAPDKKPGFIETHTDSSWASDL